MKTKISRAQISLLEKLSNAVGVSGDEDEIRKLVIEEIKPLVDEFTIDSMGNLLAIKHAKTPNALRLMFAAHIDEIGFMLVQDDGDGIFAFEAVGGIDERQLPAKNVLVGKARVPGVIGSKPIHLSSPGDRKKASPISSMRIDISPASAGKVKVGDYATFSTQFWQTGGALFGKALDDRLGVATLIELARQNPAKAEILFAFTVQEEVGLRGARVAAYNFQPEIAFAVDSTPAFDLPMVEEGAENTQYNTRLGAGPAIYLADSGTLSDPRLIHFLTQLAEHHQIPYQFRQPGGGGTDAGAIHLSRGGIPTVSISVPGRYAHSPILHARLSDWENTLSLLRLVMEEADSSILSNDR